MINLLPTLGFAKNRNGDSFKAYHESTFPQIGLVKKLNSLQVWASPLIGDLFTSSRLETNDKIKSTEEHLKIFKLFPEIQNVTSNINEIHKMNLFRASSKIKVWSHHLLPTNKGGVAFRYADPDFQANSDNWIYLLNKFEQTPANDLITHNLVNNLSPIEKYEFLIGNNDYSISKNQWTVGKELMARINEIPNWAGSCHGTAPASMRYERPKKSISLKSFNKQNDITFYPTDIKELLSYAWANDGSPSEMIGNRCSHFIFSESRQKGNCLDIDPASFHLTIIYLLGKAGWPFIIDSSAGNEVWNKTIVSYSYSYFRPGTKSLTENLQSAILKYADYKNDPFKEYRSKNIKSIIGINLELTYLAATLPNQEISNTESSDVYEKMQINYDLELDENDVIIGGEWKNNVHPDFLWAISLDYYPRINEDFNIGSRLLNYDGKNSLDNHSAELAQNAARKNKVLFTLLEAMVRLSNE